VTDSGSVTRHYVIAYTTFAERAEALRMAHDLIDRRLAACAQVHEITSVYRWQGQVEEAAEFMLTVKTAAARVSALKAHILATHSYEVPELLVVPVVAGHERYLRWIDENIGIDGE
jgi:periplasmic divalent cation tolerance protein